MELTVVALNASVCGLDGYSHREEVKVNVILHALGADAKPLGAYGFDSRLHMMDVLARQERAARDLESWIQHFRGEGLTQGQLDHLCVAYPDDRQRIQRELSGFVMTSDD